jgi:hypothetical protein
MKNGFTPREAARFLLAEKPAHFPDPGDVIEEQVILMKCPQYNQNPGHFIRVGRA